MNNAFTNTQEYLGYKISFCQFWGEQWVIFWPATPGSDYRIPKKFDTIEEAKAFIRENDDTPEYSLMRYLAE